MFYVKVCGVHELVHLLVALCMCVVCASVLLMWRFVMVCEVFGDLVAFVCVKLL